MIIVQKRLQKLRVLIHTKRLPALFVTSPQNVAYLSGFRGHASSDVLVPCLTDPEMTLLVTPHGVYSLADKRYENEQRSKNEENLNKRKMIRSDQNALRHIVVEKNVFETVRQLSQKLSIRKMGIEEDALRVSDFAVLKQKMKGVVFRDASSIIQELRRIKDENEIAALTEACRVTDRAFSALLRFIRIGMTEGDIAHFLIDFFYRHADGPSFPPIIASGRGAAIPHYTTSKTKKIRRGEMVLLDFGAEVEGYHADMSRTIFIGKATPQFKKIYHLVLEAQEKTIAGLHVGMSGKNADAIARKTLTNAGYKKKFAHGTGHGVGLQIHEAPRLSPFSNDIMTAGNVVTVEPGLYFPNWGGVRIEDTILLTPRGPQVLTRSSKQLIEI